MVRPDHYLIIQGERRMYIAIIGPSHCCRFQVKHILLAQLQSLLTTCRGAQQSGFIRGRSTTDATLALHLLSKLHREFSQPLHVSYVFDSVDHLASRKALCASRTPIFVVHLIKDLHQNTTSIVCVNGRPSQSFATSGVLAPAVLYCN